MTITTEINKTIITADGVQVDFDYTYVVLEEAHMNVYLDNVLEPTANWSITGLGAQAGGTVTMATAPAASVKITLLRIVPNNQVIDYSAYGPFPAETHERALDLRVMEAQQTAEETNRALKAPLDDESGFDYILPSPAAGKSWKVNATNDAIILTTYDPDEAQTDSAASAAAAGTSATDSQLRAWEAEAEQLTADSYATEAEGVYVNTYTSDGDGTFTATATTEYSSLHWAAQSATAFNAFRKNKIINGNFDIWQRATSQTASGYGSDDRWLNAYVGSTSTCSQVAFTLGQTAVPNNPKYYSSTVVTSVAGISNYAFKYQKIEGVETSSGENITVSFYAKADAVKNMALGFLQYFGSGGTPSANVIGIGVQKVALTTAWQKFEVTVAIPSVAGKVLGTDGNDCFQLEFWFDAGSDWDTRTDALGQQSGTFDIAQVQVETGTSATGFELRTIGEELALCQRYYEKSYDLDVVPGTASHAGKIIAFYDGVTSATHSGVLLFRFNTPKRAAPSMVLYSNISGAGGYAYDSTNAVDVAATASNIGTTGALALVVSSAAATSCNLQCQYVASAEL